MANYLVTGGCGFIGSHLVRRLVAEGHDVVVLDDLSTGRRTRIPPGVKVMVEDISSSDGLDALVGRADGVFHLAAVASVEKCSRDWVESHTTNATGTLRVFEASRAATSCIPVVWASSAAVYGVQKNARAEETDQVEPLSPYGADKLSCELHGAVAAALFGVPNIGLRFFNVYGPGQDPSSPYSGVISIFVERARKKRPVTVNGDGSAVRDFVHVDDVVDALLAAMRALSDSRTGASTPRVLNVCTGRPTRISDLLETVCQATGERPPILHGPERPGDIHASVGSPAALGRHLGVQCRTTLQDGLVRMLVESPDDE